MSNMSKCFSCVHKNDYDPKFGYYGCNLSGQECKGYSMFEPKAKPKPTNADRIRSMSDEELAMWINDVTTNALSALALGSNKQTKTLFYWLDWLQQEAE